MNRTEDTDIVKFMVPGKRQRFTELLSKSKGRQKIVDGLYHFKDFEPRYVIPIPPDQQTEDGIVGLLESLGAPEQCHVMSTISEIDHETIGLRNAIGTILGKQQGSFISCISGVLGYYEGEALGDRVILKRPNQAL